MGVYSGESYVHNQQAYRQITDQLEEGELNFREAGHFSNNAQVEAAKKSFIDLANSLRPVMERLGFNGRAIDNEINGHLANINRIAAEIIIENEPEEQADQQPGQFHPFEQGPSEKDNPPPAA